MSHHPMQSTAFTTSTNTTPTVVVASTHTTMTATTTATSHSSRSNDTTNNDNHTTTPATTTTTTNTTTTTTTTAHEKMHQYRNRLGEFVNHPYLQFCIILFIAINSLMLGLATCAFVKEDPYVTHIFETTDQIFLIIFTIELICQFLYLGVYLFRDPWLVFDLLLIVSSWVFQDLTIIRSFRIFRTLRLITRIKVMRNLVLALFSVVPRMIAIFLLLTLVSYIFAVMMTQLFKDLYTGTSTSSTEGVMTNVPQINYFGRIDASFLTLFQLMTLDAWADVANDVMMEHSWGWIPIIIYIIIAGFVVVNLVIAVICDAVSALKDDDKAKLHGTYHDATPGAALVHSDTITSKTAQQHSRRRTQARTLNTTTPTTAMNGIPIQPRNVIISEERNHNHTDRTHDATRRITGTETSVIDPSIPLPIALFEDRLMGLEQQVQELVQLQEATIQHVVSMTQQFQKTRMDLLSSATTNHNTTTSTSS